MAIVLENYNGARKLIATGAPQQEIDDSVIAPDRMWSSKKLIEISTSQFETTGNPVAVSPFAYSPLGVKINFTPKQSGTGDPSPDNIRPISGYDEVAVTRCGKNLSQINYLEGVIWAVKSSDIVNQLNRLPPGEYAISALFTITQVKDGTPNSGYYGFVISTAQKPLLTRNSYNETVNIGSTFLFTGTFVKEKEDVIENVYLYSPSSDGASGFSTSNVSNIQLEVGSTPTAYEPYQGSTTTLTLPETIYGGTVDAVTGVGSEEWDIVTLTSDFLAANTWTYGTNGNQTSPVIYGEIPMANDRVGDIYCTHFKLADSVPIENLEYWSDSNYFGYKHIAIRNDEWTSLETAKAWLDAQADASTPVQVAYKLATPSAFTSDGYKTIQPLEGVNTIYSDTDSVTVSGRTLWTNVMEGGN